MSDGRRFQADGAATEKELLESLRLNRGTIKSPRDVDRSRVFVLQKTICGGIYARVYCIFSACTISLQRKFTFAISSPDEFLVLCSNHLSVHAPIFTYCSSTSVCYLFIFISGVDVAQQKWVNLSSVEQADRKNEIVQMCWNDNEHTQVC